MFRDNKFRFCKRILATVPFFLSLYSCWMLVCRSRAATFLITVNGCWIRKLFSFHKKWTDLVRTLATIFQLIHSDSSLAFWKIKWDIRIVGKRKMEIYKLYSRDKKYFSQTQICTRHRRQRKLNSWKQQTRVLKGDWDIYRVEIVAPGTTLWFPPLIPENLKLGF